MCGFRSVSVDLSFLVVPPPSLIFLLTDWEVVSFEEVSARLESFSLPLDDGLSRVFSPRLTSSLLSSVSRDFTPSFLSLIPSPPSPLPRSLSSLPLSLVEAPPGGLFSPLLTPGGFGDEVLPSPLPEGGTVVAVGAVSFLSLTVGGFVFPVL